MLDNKYIFSFQHLYNFNWENLEPAGIQTHISCNLVEHLNLLNHQVHLFPVSVLDRQE